MQVYDAPTLLPLSRLRLPAPVLAAAPAARGSVALLLGPPANAVQEIGLRHFSLRRRLPLPFQPAALLSASSGIAYVAGTDASGWGWVAELDLGSFRLRSAVRVGRQPVSLALTPALTPDRGNLLVADAGTNSVHVLNAASLHRTGRLSLPFSPRQVVALPFGQQAFALGPSQVAAFDWSRAGLLCLLPVGASPQGRSRAVGRPGSPPGGAAAQFQLGMMLLKPDGGELYVSNAAGSISVIDTSTDVVAATMAAGAGASGLAVSPSGANLYIANAAAGTVSVLDLATRRQLAVIRVGEQPATLTLSPGGQYLFVADRASDDIAIVRSNLDPDNPNSLVTLLPAPPQPRILLAQPGRP